MFKQKIPIPHTEKLIYLAEVEQNHSLREYGIEEVLKSLEDSAKKSIERDYFMDVFIRFLIARKKI